MAQTLGPYTLGKPLGALPFGDLFEATHAARRERLAILIVSDDLAGDERLRGLLKLEIVRAAGLHHPGIARPIEVGEHDGALYVVLQRIGGTALAHRLAEGRHLGPEDTSRLVLSASEAVDALHDRRLMHGLLAPESIFVDDDGAATLVGVGLLTAIDVAGLGDAIGARVNRASIAPEQRAGRRAVASADGYALGALAHLLLIGVAPPDAIDEADPGRVGCAHGAPRIFVGVSVGAATRDVPHRRRPARVSGPAPTPAPWHGRPVGPARKPARRVPDGHLHRARAAVRGSVADVGRHRRRHRDARGRRGDRLLRAASAREGCPGRAASGDRRTGRPGARMPVAHRVSSQPARWTSRRHPRAPLPATAPACARAAQGEHIREGDGVPDGVADRRAHGGHPAVLRTDRRDSRRARPGDLSRS